MKQKGYNIAHTYRENNKAAEILANWGFEHRRSFFFQHGSLPRKLTGIVKIDGAGLKSVRIPKL